MMRTRLIFFCKIFGNFSGKVCKFIALNFPIYMEGGEKNFLYGKETLHMYQNYNYYPQQTKPASYTNYAIPQTQYQPAGLRGH
jgi:hypothetical protein